MKEHYLALAQKATNCVVCSGLVLECRVEKKTFQSQTIRNGDY